jgi:mannose-6-phosphate isomerase-like protein (cupin superfamily)
MAARALIEGETTRFALILVTTEEAPHKHEADKTLFVLGGRGRIHFGGVAYEVRPGTVIEVPAGVEHRLENLERGGLEAYVVFTPAARATPPKTEAQPKSEQAASDE